MRRGELRIEWRGKVNPFFVLAIQYGRFAVRLLKELQRNGPDIKQLPPTILAQVCRETIPLLPHAPLDNARIGQELTARLEKMEEDDWFNEPGVRDLVIEIMRRIQGTPKELLMKGFTKPHWWMTRKEWSEVLQKEHLQESFINALAILHFKTTAQELKERAIHGDLDLLADLFNKKALISRPASVENLVSGVKDKGIKILGYGLAGRRDPPGHQLELRMVLFFGWDFGLRDLSNDQLYTFLTEMHLIPSQYEPETLRKYRDRMRQLVKRTGAASAASENV